MRFRFIGSESHIGEVRLSAFGQPVELDAETAHMCITGGVGLLPDDKFESVELTTGELERHADYDQHRDNVIDPVFADKKRTLHTMYVKYKAEYEKAVAVGDTFMSRHEMAQKQTTAQTPAPAPTPAPKYVPKPIKEDVPVDIDTH